MAKYFALVGADGVVENVIVAEQEFIDANPAPAGKKWVETKKDDPEKRYGGIGQEYHEDIDAFISKKPFPSWVRDDEKAEYKAPVEKPKDGKEHKWDESQGKWEVDQEMEKRKEDLAKEKDKK